MTNEEIIKRLQEISDDLDALIISLKNEPEETKPCLCSKPIAAVKCTARLVHGDASGD